MAVRIPAAGATVGNPPGGVQRMPRASQMQVQSRKRMQWLVQMCQG